MSWISKEVKSKILNSVKNEWIAGLIQTPSATFVKY